MSKIYMAGPLFTEAEVAQRIKEYNSLKEVNEALGLDVDVFTPILAPQNDKSKLPTAKDVFEGDEDELMESSVIFADLTHEDAGVMMELGMVLHKDVKVYSYLSDIRLGTAGEYDGLYIPFGYNQFVIGGLEKYFGKVYQSYQEALDAYKADFSK